MLEKLTEKEKTDLYTAIRAARAGREVLLKYFGKIKNIEKKFQAGLVSEADKMSEKAIVHCLLQQFPNDLVLGEESFTEEGYNSKIPPQVRRWIIDPLDGTTNYIHQFPVFAVSIGLEVDGAIKVGVIDVPLLNEVYTAVEGKGAFVNGQRLHVSKCQDMSDSFLSTGFFAEQEAVIKEQLGLFDTIVRKCRAVRRPGAAAYDLALVAKGVFDGFWERGLKPWDSAAGILLVREAGGVVKTFQGDDYHHFNKSLIAGNSFVVEQIIKEFESSKVPLLSS
jgi:myo-inositol-1(or 4)-monophosphatase